MHKCNRQVSFRGPKVHLCLMFWCLTEQHKRSANRFNGYARDPAATRAHVFEASSQKCSIFERIGENHSHCSGALRSIARSLRLIGLRVHSFSSSCAYSKAAWIPSAFGMRTQSENWFHYCSMCYFAGCRLCHSTGSLVLYIVLVHLNSQLLPHLRNSQAIHIFTSIFSYLDWCLRAIVVSEYYNSSNCLRWGE